MRLKHRWAGRVTLIAAALSLAPLVLIAAAAWDVWRLVPAMHERSQAVRQLIGRIDYLDEALTSSAMLAAATGDPQWETRYRHLDSQIHTAIDSLTIVASAVGQPASGPSVLAVEDSLQALERHAFELVRADQREAAWALLVSPEYTATKQMYQGRKAVLLGGLEQWLVDAESRMEDRLLAVAILAAVSFLILLVVWAASAHVIRREMRQREIIEGELRDRAIESRRLAVDVREAEARLRAIVDVTPVGIVQVDRQRLVRYWNPAAERIFGWSAEEVLGEPYPLSRPEDKDQAEQLFQGGFAGEILDGVELHRQRKDGSEVRVRTWNAPVTDDTGEITGLVGVFADVTEQRALEQRLARAEKLEAVGRLAGGIAHDFNNVMTAVQGHADLLLESVPADDPIRADVAEIRASAARATDLTRQLLAFSSRQILQPRVLDMATVVRGLQPMLSRLLGEHVRLDVDVSGTIGRVEADPAQVEQVIVNLAINARDAMPGGGLLRLRLDEVDVDQAEAGTAEDETAAGRYVRLVVSDTGEGMDERTLHQIFEPFFTTKPPGEGTGLGLATVFGIVKQSGGHIRVDSARRSGTTFEVLLPRVEKPLSNTLSRSETAPPATVSGHETVLLVEDDDAIRSLIERVLRQNGYHVVAAATPVAALEFLEDTTDRLPDALITDLMLPDMSGQEVARRIMDRHPGIRIVFISGYTREDLANIPTAGTSTFLPKPFRPAELLRTLRAVLDYRAT